MALFTVAFPTTKRGHELSRTLIQRILRLPNECGLLFNFQWGETLRSGADHLLTVSYDHQCWATCPVRAVEQFVATGTAYGWDMTKGYLFPTISPGKSGGFPTRVSRPISAPQITTALEADAIATGERRNFFVHSFRSGGAISQAPAGENLRSDIQRAYLEAAEHGLEVYAPHASRRARNKCSLHGRRGFRRRVPPDERVPP